MDRSDLVPAPVLVVGAIASVQSGAAIATKLFPEVGVGGSVLLRLVVSALLLLGFTRPALGGHPRQDIGLVVAFGLVLAVMNCMFYLAIDRVPLGVGVTVEFLGPLGVAIAGSRRPLDFVWAALAALGVAMLAGVPGHLDIVGLIFAAAAGVCWAAYILLAQRVGRAFPGLSGLAIALGVGMIAMIPYGVASGGRHLLRGGVIAKGVGIGVLSSAVPYSLELAALRRLRAAVFGVLMSLEPAMAALSGLVFLSQRLHWQEWASIVAVVIASVGATAKSEIAEPAAEVLG
ncbi:MAG TPA: EamA family transporter [Mycobacteriales bacterium]|nr:EamA family transporter [Mycobacteriales bacterium]